MKLQLYLFNIVVMVLFVCSSIYSLPIYHGFKDDTVDEDKVMEPIREMDSSQARLGFPENYSIKEDFNDEPTKLQRYTGIVNLLNRFLGSER